MAETLKHRPFAGLERPQPEVTVIRKRRTDPESGLSLVRQIRATPPPTDPPPNARLTPDPVEPDPVAPKKMKHGGKKAFILANPDVGAKDLVKEGKKLGISVTESYVYNVRQVKKTGKKAKKPPVPPSRKKQLPAATGSIEDLLRAIVREEIKSMFSKGMG